MNVLQVTKARAGVGGFRVLSLACLLPALLLLASGTASGSLINIDINGQNVEDGDPPGATYAGAAPAGGGVWNPYTATRILSATPTDPPLQGPYVTSVGGLTSVTLDISSSFADNLAGTGGASANSLMDDYVAIGGSTTGFDGPSPVMFTLAGLVPTGVYDLYLYASPGTFTGNNSVFTITTGTPSGAATMTAVGGGFAGTFVLDTNYVLFPSVAADGSGVIGGNFAAGLTGSFAVLDGIQVVGTFAGPVPEPSTFVLSALGLLGMGCLGWRRRKRS